MERGTYVSCAYVEYCQRRKLRPYWNTWPEDNYLWIIKIRRSSCVRTPCFLTYAQTHTEADSQTYLCMYICMYKFTYIKECAYIASNVDEHRKYNRWLDFKFQWIPFHSLRTMAKSIKPSFSSCYIALYFLRFCLSWLPI